MGRDEVAYKQVAFPRSYLSGRRLDCLEAMHRLGDHGLEVLPGTNGDFVLRLPTGAVFAASELSLRHVLLLLDERFVHAEYEPLQVEGAVVIDIGGNIGDSAIYFAMRGAARVYAYEPLRLFYDAARENIRLNGLTTIEVIRAAVGPPESAATAVMPRFSWDGAVRGLQEEVPQVSLRAVLRALAAEHPGVAIILKVDCEGCEYEVLVERNLIGAGAQQIQQLMVEYHRSTPEPIEAVLAAVGFEVTDLGGRSGARMLLAERPPFVRRLN